MSVVTGKGPKGEQGDPGAGATEMDGLSDAIITSVASGELLKWNGSAWVNNTLAEAGVAADDHTHTMRLPHTWAISGEIAVPSGDVDYILPFFVSLASGQTAKLVKARHRINSGTSVTCKLQKNGGDITGFTGISVTTTTTNTDPADVTLADDDMLALVVTGVAGTPKNMSFTVFVEYSV